MSFNFQGPGEMPIIRGAQNMMNNGGGGNLGYFQGRQKKKEENKNQDLFNTSEEDSFTLSSGADDDDFPENIEGNNSGVDAIKNFFGKILKSKKKKS